MADKPNKEFGKRRPVSVPASPPPAKRSGHVALLLMGTFAVGSAAYALMPNRNCETSPNSASPYQQGSTECSSRSSSSSSHSGSGGSSSRYYSGGSSSSSHSSSGSYSSGTHSAQRSGFGSFGHAIGFSGG